MDNSSKNSSDKPERTHGQPVEAIAADIPNAVAQAELLRAEQLFSSITPNLPSTPRPKLSRSTPFSLPCKPLSAIGPPKLSRSNLPLGSPVNKLAPHGMISSPMLKGASLN